MSVVKTWISALRLRTLPLAISGILAGAYVAQLYTHLNEMVLLLSITTAVALQILSNLANDYGDYVKGTDNDNRLGNTRALQSGNISVAAMRTAIVFFAVLSLVSGIALLWQATSGELNVAFLLFFTVGIAAIAAAIKYTIGNNAYGYKGLGDVFVYLFFGPVAVMGSFLLQNEFQFDFAENWPALMLANTIGLLSAAVLNTNNIRDIENDRESGKTTLVVKIGLRAARFYHTALILTALFTLIVFMANTTHFFVGWLPLLAYAPVLVQLKHVWEIEPSPAYNALLKQLSLATLVLVLTFIFTSIFITIFELGKLVSHTLN